MINNEKGIINFQNFNFETFESTINVASNNFEKI